MDVKTAGFGSISADHVSTVGAVNTTGVNRAPVLSAVTLRRWKDPFRAPKSMASTTLTRSVALLIVTIP